MEYLALCGLMTSGVYDGADLRRISADRTNAHNELIRVLGAAYERPFDMKAYCRQLFDEEAALSDT